MPNDHVVLVSMPKSASVFVRAALERSAGLVRHSFGGPLPFLEQSNTQEFHDFLEAPRAQGGEHMAASPYNLSMLRQGGIARVTLLLRDPRDALVSWRHNLERDDIDKLGWHRTMLVADGQIPADYYDLSWEAKLDALTARYLPRLIAWRDRWLAVTALDVQVLHYEDMHHDAAAFVRSILEFHRVEHTVITLPDIDRDRPLDTETHFRRGEVGSYRDEMTPEQIRAVNPRVGIPNDAVPVFLHIPSTGGASLTEAIARALPDTFVLRGQTEFDAFNALPPAEHARLPAIAGHIPQGVHRHIGRDCAYLTMFREPVDRIVSGYVRHMLDTGRDPASRTFREFLDDGNLLCDNPYTRRLCDHDWPVADTRWPEDPPFGGVTEEMFRQAQRNLARCRFVGIFERYRQTAERLFRFLGLPFQEPGKQNITDYDKSLVTIDEMSLSELRHRNRYDLALYEQALRQFETL